MLQIGKSAPNFKLRDTKKEEVSLDQFKGKKVVVAFFPAAFTGVCEKELCTFRDAMANYGNLNAQVIGISVDGPFANAAFVEKNKLNFPVLSDYMRETVRAYDVAHEDFAGLPGYVAAKRSVFVVGADGNLKWSWIAPVPKDEPDYEAVKKAVEAA